MVGMEGQSLPLLPDVSVLTAHSQGCSPKGARGDDGLPCQRAGTPLQACCWPR